MSKMGSFFNLSHLNTTLSRIVISFFDISATNLIVGWDLLACSISSINRSPAAEERCVTTLYTDNYRNRDTNGEHTMLKFNINSLHLLSYIFQDKIGTLNNVPSTLGKIPWTKRQTLEFALSDINLL